MLEIELSMYFHPTSGNLNVITLKKLDQFLTDDLRTCFTKTIPQYRKKPKLHPLQLLQESLDYLTAKFSYIFRH